MVGVEDVGGEELWLSQWREDGGWTGMDGEHGGITLGEGERSEHMALMDGGVEGVKWGEKETQRWSERVGELELFRDRAGDAKERKQGDEGEMKDEKQEGGEEEEEEGKMEFKGELQNKKKEDEGGGMEGGVDGGGVAEIDRRECRCTHYAVTSGLVSAMIVLSNLYFLVPLCILGLVYSLIGRTLWLRPKSSRRDQSHRNTVKMLGVIVLAFVVCWLPFHVGRTIFSFSLDTGTDMSHSAEYHVNSDTSPHTPDTTTYNTQNSTPTTVNSQYNHIDRYGAAHASLYHYYTHNSTYSHHDAHLDFMYYLSQYFNLVSSVLFYLSAAVNPLLYNLMSARYRHAVHSLIRARSHTQAHHLRSTLTARHSTTTL
uniref:Growth hormone secretagogue receptor type 1-like n=2 Tax=Acanthochromis polyacanthus TaxID=80966 RepID=A0A3Q1H017_9TELE